MVSTEISLLNNKSDHSILIIWYIHIIREKIVPTHQMRVIFEGMLPAQHRLNVEEKSDNP